MSKGDHDQHNGTKTYEADLLQDTLISVFTVGIVILIFWLLLFWVYLARN